MQGAGRWEAQASGATRCVLDLSGDKSSTCLSPGGRDFSFGPYAAGTRENRSPFPRASGTLSRGEVGAWL